MPIITINFLMGEWLGSEREMGGWLGSEGGWLGSEGGVFGDRLVTQYRLFLSC